jgi:DNA-binding transcriptional ArsR family regulator
MVPNRKAPSALNHPRRSPAHGQAVFRALADPTRRRILGLLRVSGRSVGELAGNFPMSRPAISKHLRLLRSAGLVSSHRRGTARICELNAQPLRTVNEWLRDYQRFWEGNLRRLKQFVEENP